MLYHYIFLNLEINLYCNGIFIKYVSILFFIIYYSFITYYLLIYYFSICFYLYILGLVGNPHVFPYMFFNICLKFFYKFLIIFFFCKSIIIIRITVSICMLTSNIFKFFLIVFYLHSLGLMGNPQFLCTT